MHLKKEWLLTIGITILTFVVALSLIRFYAPHLLGGDRDLQLVQVSKEVPPFFENIFRKQDYTSPELIIQDPYVKRAKPLITEQFLMRMGPHDLMGFRNRSIPNIADVVTIGDSQTYGNNTMLVNNWPSQMQAALGKKKPIVYNMAVGGWGAAEYLDMFYKALLFQPQVIVVAFYTGNDPLETFQQAYGNKRYIFLKTDPSLKDSDIPKVAFPAPKSEWWRVKFKDGVSTTFTPKLRYACNQRHPAVKAGYAGMAEAGRMMGEMARKRKVKLIFTIIPTKELVYAKKVVQEGINQPVYYKALVADESDNIRRFADELSKIPEAIYVDVVDPLQKAAKQATPLYLEDINGHPIEAGYKIIARTIAAMVQPFLSDPLEGLVAIRQDKNNYLIFLVRDGKAWLVPSRDILNQNGWKPTNIIYEKNERRVTRLPLAGVMDRVDVTRFGPRQSSYIK